MLLPNSANNPTIPELRDASANRITQTKTLDIEWVSSFVIRDACSPEEQLTMER